MALFGSAGQVVRRNWLRLLAASVLGAVAASTSEIAVGWALGLPGEVLLSLIPQSVTAPVAMGIAEKIEAFQPSPLRLRLLTGLVGALSAKYL
jgi:putative effector of murein hydrolase